MTAPVCVSVDHLRGPGDDRMLELFDRHRIRTTFFVEGRHGSERAAQLAALIARGHEVGLHGWAHEEWEALDPRTERELLERGVAAIAAAAGARPVGFRAPGGARGRHTVDALVDLGFVYDASLDEGRSPRVLPQGIVALPFRWDEVDGAHYLRPEPAAPEEVESRWNAVLDRAADSGELVVFVVHAHVSCLDDGRVDVLDRLLGRVARDDRLEPVQMAAMAARVKA
jgi:peptidoglycan/xylan/chitin deacetylase (PgdA/CDA1 family)